MDNHGCRTLVFSGTSTVYGEPETFPITETSPAPIHPTPRANWRLNSTNALSRSGYWRVAHCATSSPGAHPSGRIGEDPYGIPNNLFPFVPRSPLAGSSRYGYLATTTTHPMAPASATTCM